MLTVERYFTAIIGMITIYGIIMTFYQFVSSYQKSDVVYLGYNLKEYIINKESPIQRIMINKKVKYLCVFEIVIIPVIYFLEDYICPLAYSFGVILWYGGIAIFFLLSFFAMFQSAKSVRMLNKNLDIERNKKCLDMIDQEYKDKVIKKGITLENLEKELDFIKWKRVCDKSPNLQDRYENLIYMLLNMYVEALDSESYEDIYLKNEIEIKVFDDLLSNKSIYPNEVFWEFQFKIIEYNIQSVLRKNGDVEKELFHADKNYSTELNWYSISEAIYQTGDDEERKKYIKYMTYKILYKNDSNEIKSFYITAISKCLKGEISKLSQGERSEEDIYNIFLCCKDNSEFKRKLCFHIYTQIEEWKGTMPDQLLELLDENSKIIIYIYIIGYISIYKSRAEKIKLIPVFIKKLLDGVDLRIINSEKILNEIVKYSNIGHKFQKEIYDQIIKYMYDDFDQEFLQNLVQQQLFEPAIILMIKINCLNQKYNTTSVYKDFGITDVYIRIINNLAFFPNFLDDKMRIFVTSIRYELEKYSKDLALSKFEKFEALLLSDLEIKSDDINETKISYCSRESIGKYALIKLSDENKNWSGLKYIIYKTYCNSNLSIEDYVEKISNISSLFYVDLSFVQKEKMKCFLWDLM